MSMKFRKASYLSQAKDRIDMELEHPREEWIPITITEAEYPETWAAVVATNPPVSKFGQGPLAMSALEAWRNTSVISRAEFCLGLKRMGVLDAENAKAAARGDWPPAFGDWLVDGLGGMSAEDLEILWAGLTQIQRNHPVFEELRKKVRMTPEQADVLFGAPSL